MLTKKIGMLLPEIPYMKKIETQLITIWSISDGASSNGSSWDEIKDGILAYYHKANVLMMQSQIQSPKLRSDEEILLVHCQSDYYTEKIS